MFQQTRSTNLKLPLHLTWCQDKDGMEWAADGGVEGQQSEEKECKPRPGPDNAKLSGLREEVGDISQIRTDHKPTECKLDAIQFCGAMIRRLIMCHPSIHPPPAAVSRAINPLMTSFALRQSPHSDFLSLLSSSSVIPSAVCHRRNVRGGIM